MAILTVASVKVYHSLSKERLVISIHDGLCICMVSIMNGKSIKRHACVRVCIHNGRENPVIRIDVHEREISVRKNSMFSGRVKRFFRKEYNNYAKEIKKIEDYKYIVKLEGVQRRLGY